MSEVFETIEPSACLTGRQGVELLVDTVKALDADFERHTKAAHDRVEGVMRVAENMDMCATAADILGPEQYYGPEAVKDTFGIPLSPSQIPLMPFSERELEMAQSMGQRLRLSVPGNMGRMCGTLNAKFKSDGKGRILKPSLPPVVTHRSLMRVFAESLSNYEWVLETPECIPHATGMPYPEQLALLVEYLKIAYSHMVMPWEYCAAIEEHDEWQRRLPRMLRKESWYVILRKSLQLKIVRFFCRSPMEELQGMAMTLDRNGKRTHAHDFVRTSFPSQAGMFIFIGDSSENGASIGFTDGTGSHDIGISFARRF